MCVTIRSLPFTTGVKPISLSGFNRRVGIGSHRKNLIFAPCAAAMGFYACTFGGFCAILQKAARLSHTVLLLQLIPARGRKRDGSIFLHTFFNSCNLSPRGDGNQCHVRNEIGYLCCNLSPRGDGNLRPQLLKLSKLLQLIPARGRKRRS